MIPKLINSGSFRFNEPAVALVPLHTKGVDVGFMLKRASDGMFAKEIAGLKSDPKRSVLHVLAVGDEEAYGDNRNGDAFSEADNKSCHGKFKTAGHVFKNHKNYSADLATGEVLATGHNDDMRRIELLIGLDNAKYAEELAAFERGEDIPVSMGSMQEFDVCSICGHKAPTSRQHCEHVQHKLGEVLDDGRKVYMKNPNPNYFDISTVWKPADRIGYALRKVANQVGTIGGHELAEQAGIRSWTNAKHATLVALAEMEKRVGGVGKPVSTAPTKLSPEALKQVKTAVSRHGIPAVLGYLHGNQYLLSLEDFAEAIVGQPKMACMCDGAGGLEGGFGRMLGDNTDVSSMDGQDMAPSMDLGGAEQELTDKASMKPGAVNARVIRLSIAAPAPMAKAANIDEIEVQGLKDLYLHYKLAFASHAANRGNPSILKAVAFSNHKLLA